MNRGRRSVCSIRFSSRNVALRHRAQIVREPPAAGATRRALHNFRKATRAGQLQILMSRDRGGLRAQDHLGFSEQLRNDLRPDTRSFSDRQRPEVEDRNPSGQ